MEEMNFSKQRKKMIYLINVSIMSCILLSCGDYLSATIAEKQMYVSEKVAKINMTQTKLGKSENTKFHSTGNRQEVDNNFVTTKRNGIIPYNVPLEEAAERIEYIYTYERMLSDIPRDYGKLGPLPEGDVRLAIYVTEGNKLLFLPEGKGNKEVLLNGQSSELYWEEEKEQYLFYCINDFSTQEGGIPVNSAGYGEEPWIFCCALKERDMPFGEDEYYFPRYDLDSLIRLGDIEVCFDPQGWIELPDIATEENEYIAAMVKNVQETLAEKGKFGEYVMYLGTYGRIWYPYNKYYDIDTTVFKASGCIVEEDLEQYFYFTVEDNGKVDAINDQTYVMLDQAYSLYPPSDAQIESGTYPYYFIDDDFISVSHPEHRIQKVKEMNWVRIPFSVRKGEVNHADADTAELDGIEPEYAEEIDFSKMDSKTGLDWISYICSYSEWFGMNELGYQEGELRGFMDREIILYTWPGSGSDTLYFVPAEMVNRTVTGKSGVEYPLYINRNGQAEFYCVMGNPAAVREEHLQGTLCATDTMGEDSAAELVMIGRGILKRTDLTLLEVPKVEGDEYVATLEGHIKEMLEQEGRQGGYKMYIGEYEALHSTRVCISAAVTGEEDYYFRYLIVRSQKGNYYFWPAGFGLDGSLEECEAARHHMNRVCIDRTVELERYVSEFTVR